jgi:multiple sugar transport system permease protein
MTVAETVTKKSYHQSRRTKQRISKWIVTLILIAGSLLFLCHFGG